MSYRLPAMVLVGTIVALLTTGCGTGDGSAASESAVTLGGSPAESTAAVLDRPWGQVTSAPAMVKAEEPGPADTTFAREMIPHHEQALELSRNLLRHDSVDERISASARFIVEDQENEIASMTDWLDAWAEVGRGAAPDRGDHAAMPGMVPQSRVDGLKTFAGPEAQVEFLVLMIRHHEGAVSMSRDYLDLALNSYTLATARHIIREQDIEIAYLEQVLEELCSGDQAATCPAG